MSGDAELLALLTDLDQQIAKAEAISDANDDPEARRENEHLLVELREKHAAAKEELRLFTRLYHCLVVRRL